MPCCGRRHFAAINDLHKHPRRHSSWKDSMMMEHSKMRSESSEYTWNAKAILILLENHLEECAVWDRNRMSPDMRPTWWNVKNWKLMEMILTVFRGFLPVILKTRKIARMGTNLERARRILGMSEPRSVQMETGHADSPSAEELTRGFR